jgi:predicted nucleic acid-binding protein
VTEAGGHGTSEDNDAAEAEPVLPTGPGFVCFDAGPLMKFHRHGHLGTLGEWFPRAFTADVIVQEELLGEKALRKYPDNHEIADAPWLEAAEVTDQEGHKIVRDLRRLWGSQPDRDRGEAEVVALCNRYRWTAIMGDNQGRAAAKENGKFNVVNSLTLIIAAAAHDLITEKAAWGMHRDLHAEESTALTVQNVHRPAFQRSVQHLARVTRKDGYRGWPWLLEGRALDGVPRYWRDRT